MGLLPIEKQRLALGRCRSPLDNARPIRARKDLLQADAGRRMAIEEFPERGRATAIAAPVAGAVTPQAIAGGARQSGWGRRGRQMKDHIESMIPQTRQLVGLAFVIGRWRELDCRGFANQRCQITGFERPAVALRSREMSLIGTGVETIGEAIGAGGLARRKADDRGNPAGTGFWRSPPAPGKSIAAESFRPARWRESGERSLPDHPDRSGSMTWRRRSPRCAATQFPGRFDRRQPGASF